MIKKFSIGLLLMLILAFSVTAVVPLAKFTAVSDTIGSDDNTAIYRVALSNTGAIDDKFQFYTISAFWDINPTIVNVPAESTTVFDMEVSLNDRSLIGPQLVPVTIKSLDTEDNTIENLYVYIKPSNATLLTYTPNVVMNVNMKEEIDPRNPLSIEIHMTNRNPLDIKDLRVVVDSPLFTKEVQTTLGPLEEKTNQILFGDINKLQGPGIYTINIKLVTQNKTITQVERQVRVIGYSEVSVEDTKIKGLFSYTERITLHNDGNYEATKQVKVQKNFFEKIFTTSSVKYSSLREDGISYVTWNASLKPQDSYELTVTTNYNILAVLAILIIAIVIIYYVFRSPVLLYKRAKIISSNDEGISEIRVKLHLKNRSGREIRNVKIIDRYPKIVSLVEENTIGSLRPTKMLSADKVHSLLMWNLENLEPYEERLISYTIRSKLNIVGNMSLHSAKARFQTRSGERTTSSNDVELLHKSVNTIVYE